MKLPIFQIDAFSDKVFGGNPACVVPLKNWLQDEVLLKFLKKMQWLKLLFLLEKEKTIKKGSFH